METWCATEKISTRKLMKDWCRFNRKLGMHMNNQFGDSKNAVVNFMLDFLFSAKAKDGIRQILQICTKTFLALQNGIQSVPCSVFRSRFRSTFYRGVCTVLAFSQSYLSSYVKTRATCKNKVIFSRWRILKHFIYRAAKANAKQ